MTVLEDTLPAEADCATRRFHIVDPTSSIRITVLNLTDQSIPGDEPELQADHVANNHTLAIALIRLANRLLGTPGQSLPLPVSAAGVSQSPA
jgi:hypothetical protein